MDVGTDFLDIVAKYDIDAEALRRRYDEERDLRERPDTSRQFVKVTAEFSHYVEDPYSELLQRDPIVDDDTDVLVIGAGFGGLLAAVRLREAGVERVRLVERGGDVGGTWYWNRYPGVQCDIDSYVYLPLLEETGYIPTSKYVYGDEIFEHAQRIARQFDLYDHALFQTAVSNVDWGEDDNRWHVTTDRGDRISTQFVVSANGALSQAKLPGIPGINEFTGHTFHTSRWDYEYTGGTHSGALEGLADKRVGIIGTGATAIQVVPHLGASAKQVYVFQRTPSVVGPRNNRPTDPEWAKSLEPGWQAARMDNFTRVVNGVEPDVDLVDDSWSDIWKSINPIAAVRVQRALGRELTDDERALAIEFSDHRKAEELRDRVDEEVHDPAIAEKLKAWYFLYCKRACFHDDYLATFNRPNVELVQTGGLGVDRLTENSVVIGDEEYEVDCLIFASGFEVSTSFTSQTGFDPRGRDGVLLSQKWERGPRTLHGVQVSGFPNLFFVGIVQNASTLNFTHMLDQTARHIAFLVTSARQRGGLVDVTEAAEQEWLDEMLRFATPAQRDYWLRCTPGYFNGDGDVDNAYGFFARRYGGGPVRYFEMLRAWRAQQDPAGLVFA